MYFCDESLGITSNEHVPDRLYSSKQVVGLLNDLWN